MKRVGGPLSCSQASGLQARVCLAFAILLLGAGCGETFELGPDAGALASNGDPCGASSECTNGNCVDGICCETACTGVCEACNLAGQLGICAAVAMGQDPAMECMPRPIEDVDGGVVDGGAVLNLPDGGLNVMETPCAPKCDGQRACGFPDSTVSCGDTFCNSDVELGRAVCDGEGHCGVTLEACVNYTCGPSACKTSCAQASDCQATDFCNSLGQCQPKKALGLSCGSNPNECQSGFCASGVCCNSDCGSIAGGSCNNVGFVGTCKCTIQPGNQICDGTCELYYQDADNDGYGRNTAPIVGCTGDPDNSPAPPAGYVLDHTDCADDAIAVHPNAGSSTASVWPTGLWSPAFDWNCDGEVTYAYPIRTNQSCRFCNPRSINIFLGDCGGTSTTCAVSSQRAFFGCGIEERTCAPNVLCSQACCGQGCASSSGFLFTLDDAAFTSGGACGQPGTLTVCGTCAGAGQAASPSTNNTVTQACR